MNSYRYRVTVEALADGTGQPVAEPQRLSFEAANHDDLHRIVERVRGKDLGLAEPLSGDEATAMVIGMKLFSEVALHHRTESFFADIREALGRFVRELKARPEAEALEGTGG